MYSDERGRPRLLVTAPDQRLAAKPARCGQRVFGESSFAHPRVTQKDDEAAAAGLRLIQALKQLGALSLASDQFDAAVVLG